MRITHLNLAKGFRGGERQTELLVKALDSLGMQQSVVVRRGSMLEYRLRDVPDIHLMAISKPFFKHLYMFRDGGILHAHETRAAQLAMLVNCLQGSPYIITRRVTNIPKENPYTRTVYRRAHVIVTLSKAINTVMNGYAPQTELKTIPSMTARFEIDPNMVAAIRRQYSERFLVGHTGALDMRVKGQQYIIEAARKLRKRLPEIEFLFLGSGDDERSLKKLAQDLNNVHFLGFKENVADYLAAMDVFVFPSLQEGLGSALLDAMYVNTPIIATNVGGIPDLVHNEVNGLLIPPIDPKAIQAAVIKLYKDKGLRESLCRGARESIAAYFPEVIARQYVQVYESIAQSMISKEPLE